MSVKIGSTCQSWGVGELWVSLFDKLLKGDIVSLCDLFCTRSDEIETNSLSFNEKQNHILSKILNFIRPSDPLFFGLALISLTTLTKTKI